MDIHARSEPDWSQGAMQISNVSGGRKSQFLGYLAYFSRRNDQGSKSRSVRT